MSGLEILGAAASAFQLAQVGLAITRFLLQVQDAPKTLQTRVLQVQSLIDVANLISSKPQLHTAEINTILENCLLRANALRESIQGLIVDKKGSAIKRWSKAVEGAVVEKKILGLIQELEIDKSALVLRITSIDSSLLHGIDKRLELVQGSIEDVALGMRDELPLIRTAMENLTIRQQEQNQATLLSNEKDAAACLASLSPTEQSSFRSQILSRSKLACHWFWQTPIFKNWHESQNADLIWITAPAGCGKTTLAAHVSKTVCTPSFFEVSDRKGEGGDLPVVVLSFFFHRSNQENEGIGIAALRTIINQLVRQVPGLTSLVVRRYESLVTKGKVEWSWDALWDLFIQLLDYIANPAVYVVLDALDECEIQSRRTILSSFRELVHAFNSSGSSEPLLKVFITSRPDADVFDCLSEFDTLEINSMDTAGDMTTLVNNRIGDFARRRHLDEEVKKMIVQFLQKNAQGMFLWAVLIVEELERRDERLTDEVIASKLSRLPLTLMNTYEVIVQNPPSSRKNDMWHILRWLLYGKRGLTLAELESALCLELGITRWHGFVGDVDFLCGPLITIDKEDGRINLIHQTARDFLERFVVKAYLDDDHTAGVEMDVTLANEHLAKTCIQILESFIGSFPSFKSWEETLRLTSAMDEALNRHPFIRYAIENWNQHIQATEDPSGELIQLVLNLLSSPRKTNSLMNLDHYANQGGNVLGPATRPVVYIAAYFDLPWILKKFIEESPLVSKTTCKAGDTPLTWAAEMGSEACVDLLLQTGADPNAVEHDGWTALHWAANNGHVEVARLLIEFGADLNHRYGMDEDGPTARDMAIKTNHQDVANLIESHGSFTERGLSSRWAPPGGTPVRKNIVRTYNTKS